MTAYMYLCIHMCMHRTYPHLETRDNALSEYVLISLSGIFSSLKNFGFKSNVINAVVAMVSHYCHHSIITEPLKCIF